MAESQPDPGAESPTGEIRQDPGRELVDGLIQRFRERAQAVRARGIPPLEGADRRRFVERMQQDYTDYAMLSDAQGEVVEGILVLRIDLRPKPGAKG
ncbi:MAG: hypothetical protein ACT4OS_07515 [Acidimicrobiales bacterium]